MEPADHPEPIQIIGYWAASLYDELLLPQELPLCSDTTTLAAVVRYLRGGSWHETYRGYSWCRFDCGVPHEEMGSREFTDGTWVWPEGLVHYVEVHRVPLPDAFTQKALGLSVAPPRADLTDSLSFWKTWCQGQRSQATRDLVARLRTECDRDRSTALDAYYEEVTAAHGTSSAECIWKGCQARALEDIVFCARHWGHGAGHGGPGASGAVTSRYTRLLRSSIQRPDA